VDKSHPYRSVESPKPALVSEAGRRTNLITMILTGFCMHTHRAAFYRLTILVQRVLDADVLCDGEGNALLTETEAALYSLEAGDTETARRHVEQVAHFMEIFVESKTLTRADGSAILEMTRFILAGADD
jgi:hypothetical protein